MSLLSYLQIYLNNFLVSVYPTISSGKKSKVLIVSTPHGMNMFYKLWNDAEHKRNDYVPIEVHWTEVLLNRDGKEERLLETLVRHNLLLSLSVSL